MLTHKAFCAYCQQSLIADCGTGSRGNVYRYYKCEKKKNDNQPCNKKQHNKNYLEDKIVYGVDEVLTDEFIKQTAKQVNLPVSHWQIMNNVKN